jgi:hypothetical protein
MTPHERLRVLIVKAMLADCMSHAWLRRVKRELELMRIINPAYVSWQEEQFDRHYSQTNKTGD